MQTSCDILIFAGTGHLGQDVIQALGAKDASIRVVSRRARPTGETRTLQWAQADLAAGHGVEESVRAIQTILFCAGNPKQHAAVEIDGLRRLLAVARNTGVAHFVFVSIVGIDHLPVPYYRTKLAAERLVRESGVPFTILRATQFHYFVDLLLSALARTPFVLPVPKGFRVQPVATEDVAERLVRCLADGPQGLLKDFCGPEIFTMPDVAALWKQVRGIHKPVVPIPIPGKFGATFREGYNTNAAGETGVTRWEDWLARELKARQI